MYPVNVSDDIEMIESNLSKTYQTGKSRAVIFKDVVYLTSWFPVVLNAASLRWWELGTVSFCTVVLWTLEGAVDLK